MCTYILIKPNFQVKELDGIMTQFVESAKDGTYEEKGFKSTAYGMSKVGLSALTRIQQQQFDKVYIFYFQQGPDLRLQAICQRNKSIKKAC